MAALRKAERLQRDADRMGAQADEFVDRVARVIGRPS
jgi:hypothetical protein